jgi:hypothetical protein
MATGDQAACTVGGAESPTARGQQPNTSYFAFTATPKGSTLEQLYKLEAHVEKELPKGKAQTRIAAYARFHAYAKDQKARSTSTTTSASRAPTSAAGGR